MNYFDGMSANPFYFMGAIFSDDGEPVEAVDVNVSYLTTTLVIGSPEIGNRYNYNNGLQVYANLAGESIYVRPSYWATTHRLSFRFNHLSITKSAEVISFLELSFGQIITLTDHTNTVWTGVITNPLEAIQYIRADAAVVAIEFVGETV